MRISNGNFLDEDGNEVNLVELLRTGKATPVVNNNDGHHMSAHSGWFTDENGTPVNIVALIDAAIDEDGGDDEPPIGGISINGGNVVTPDANGIINLTISGDGSTVIDSELSASSTNPVQNKVVTGEIEELNEAVDSLNGSLDTLGAFLNTVPVDTASGAVATFADGADNVPVKSLTVDIEPIQSGTGDPSPDNVRPISGWTGAKITCNNETINIDWTNEAGTVYGGTLDVTNGKLTVDRAMVDLGTLTWTYFTRTTPPHFGATVTNLKRQTNNILCSAYEVIKGSQYTNKDKTIRSTAEHNEHGIKVSDTSYTDAAAFKTAMSGVQFVFELDTPTTVQLTAQEVSSLYGSNSFSADCGDTSVTYRADTSLYVTRKISEAISALS